MIDTKELRRLASQYIGISVSSPVSPRGLIELLDRLEAAESALSNLGVTSEEAKEGLARHKATLARLEAAEKERELLRALNNFADEAIWHITQERDALRAALQHEADCVEAAKAEIDALRAKIERMERQEPAWFIDERGDPKRYHKSKADYCKYGGLDLLYALPGAKGDEK